MGGLDGTVLVVSPQDERRVAVAPERIASVVASPGCNRLAVLRASGVVTIHRLDDGRVLSEIEPHPPATPQPAGRPTQMVVAAGGEISQMQIREQLSTDATGTLGFASGPAGRCFRLVDGEVLARFSCDPVSRIDPVGRLVASPGFGLGYPVELIEAANGLPAGTMGHERLPWLRGAYALAWSEDGKNVATSWYEKYVDPGVRELILLTSKSSSREVVRGPSEFVHLDVSHDGSLIAYATADNVVGVCAAPATATPCSQVPLAGMDAPVVAVAFGLGGGLLVIDIGAGVTHWAPENLVRGRGHGAMIVLRATSFG